VFQSTERHAPSDGARRARFAEIQTLPQAETRRVVSVDYWYVRARQSHSGREIQRIAPARCDGYGLATAAMAADDMKAFLVAMGLATEGANGWEIVEVHRFGESPHRGRGGN